MTDLSAESSFTLMHKLPYYTTMAGAEAVSEAIAALKAGSLEVRPLQDYFKKA
jgi:carbamoyl-phosphate synthase large subunit